MANKSITKEAVRQVLRDYAAQYRRRPVYALIAFFLPAIGSVFVFFVPPLIVARLVNIFAAQGKIAPAAFAWYIALFGGLWLIGEAFWRLGLHFLIQLETEGLNRLFKSSFRRLTERDYDFYTNNFVGSLTKMALAYVRGFETFSDTLSFNVVTNVFPVIFAVVVLWFYSPVIPIVLLTCIALAFSIGLPIVRRRSTLVAARHEASSKVSGRFSDAMTNILAVKSFAREDGEGREFGPYVDDLSAKFKKAADYQNLRFDLAISPIYVAANVIGLTAAVFFTQLLGLPAGTMVVVFSYYAQVTRVFWEINRVYRNFESSISEAAEFTQILIEPPAISDIPGAGTLRVGTPTIHFDHVGFTYGREQGAPLFLRDFDLEIRPHQKVGLVGPSGGGKTTITKLLLRFIDLDAGRILIDGQNVAAVTQASLRRNVAYVPQEPLLFHRSLLENISYGSDAATEADVVRAAKLAHADEFIRNLPEGYRTLVGERGVKLSGGQRQRVAIARAILKQAPILVLDEATSSLDSESEKYIQAGLAELMKDKTALIIAHRLSTIKNLDRILVLDKGKIVEDGTHAELIAKAGLYARLWSHQSGEFLKEE